MLYFPKFFSGLILFSPAAYAIATPDQAQVGTVRGFTGPKDAEVTFVSSQDSVNWLGHIVLTPKFHKWRLPHCDILLLPTCA